MREFEHPPSAPSLMESMRSMGYSLGSALADLIDNSIAARAGQVEIEFRPFDEPYMAVIDDGKGMLPDQLDEAMRHGSRSPLDLRAEGDLGRFGLGLKTASLSQCKRMTVVSLCDQKLSARCWDMDIVHDRKKWVLLELDQDEAGDIPHVDRLKSRGHGTIVLWQKLDRLLAGELDVEAGLGLKVDEARGHLSLVFHRYLSGEAGLRKLTIRINGHALPATDPFLQDHSLTQKLEDDRFQIQGHTVNVKPFILPHPSRLSPGEAESAGGLDGLRGHQGFYVYRQKRLIIWGTWFRLARKDELSRLARVRVDIPNSLDNLWTLDIRKSVAYPPEVVRLQLKRTIERIRERSRITHQNRGHIERSGPIERGWVRAFADGKVRYDINREHHAIRALEEGLDSLGKRRLAAILKVLEVSFPVESLYVDVASEQRVRRLADEEQELSSIAQELVLGLRKGSTVRKGLLENLHLIEPFNAHPEIAKRIAKELMNE